MFPCESGFGYHCVQFVDLEYFSFSQGGRYPFIMPTIMPPILVLTCYGEDDFVVRFQPKHLNYERLCTLQQSKIMLLK